MEQANSQQDINPHPALRYKRWFLVIGIMELTMGCVMVVVGYPANLLVFIDQSYSLLIILASGALGVAASQDTRKATVTSGLVISCLSCATCGFSVGAYIKWVGYAVCKYNIESEPEACGFYITYSALNFIGFALSLIHFIISCRGGCCCAYTEADGCCTESYCKPCCCFSSGENDDLQLVVSENE